MATPPPSSDNDARPAEPNLHLQDLKTADYLKAEPRLTVDQKAALARYLARGLTTGSGGGEDVANAEAILRLLIWNAEPQVAEAMARAAAENPNTPRSLAWALANDEEAAAVLVLEACAALADADLLSIVQSSENFGKMNAIARRSSVSADVSRSLVHHGNEGTAQTLLDNAKAQIPEDAFGSLLDRFGRSEGIQEAIIDREAVFPSITRRLSDSMTNPRLEGKLAARHHPPAEAPIGLPGFVIERSEEEWNQRLSRMMAEKSLTESMLVRTLCNGDFDFFARALAELTRSPTEATRRQLLESPSGLQAVWSQASLLADWLSVASAALSALVQIDRATGKSDRELFARNVVDRTLANLKAEKVALSAGQLRVFAPPRAR